MLTVMRLVLDHDATVNTIRSYGSGEVQINDRRCTAPCIVTPQQLIIDWPVPAPQQLTLQQLQPLLQLQPQIVLVGVAGGPLRAPAELRRELESRGIALEFMDLGGACRTYNVLAQEGRAVAAALFPLPGT